MYFDARAAKLLPPGEHMVVDGCPGLRLVAAQTGKTWTYRYKDAANSGLMKQVRIGQWPVMPVHAAATAWQALRDQREAGVDPCCGAQGCSARPPRSIRLRVYTVRKTGAGLRGRASAPEPQDGKGFEAAENMFDRIFEDPNPEFADKPAEAVEPRSDAFEVLESRKATPTSAQKLRSLLGSAWDYALDSGRLTGDTPNWWRQVQRGRLKSKGKIIGGEHQGQTRRVLNPEEIARLLAWLPNMHACGRDLVLMHLWTATRGAEILSMQPEHITQTGQQWWWTVPKSLTKNANVAQAVDLRVPLFGQALAVVQRRMASIGASGLMWEDTKGKAYSQHDFSTYIYNLQPYSPKVTERQSTGGLVLPVTHWTPHNLRRTASTMLSSLGCIKEYREAILGHVQPGVEGVYNAYTYDAERVEWLKRLSDRMQSLMPK
jgi:integrase